MIAWGVLAFGIIGFIIALSVGGSRGAPAGAWAMFLLMALVAGFIIFRRHSTLFRVVRFKLTGSAGPTRYGKHIAIGFASLVAVLVIIFVANSGSNAPRQQTVARATPTPTVSSTPTPQRVSPSPSPAIQAPAPPTVLIPLEPDTAETFQLRNVRTEFSLPRRADSEGGFCVEADHFRNTQLEDLDPTDRRITIAIVNESRTTGGVYLVVRRVDTEMDVCPPIAALPTLPRVDWQQSLIYLPIDASRATTNELLVRNNQLYKIDNMAMFHVPDGHCAIVPSLDNIIVQPYPDERTFSVSLTGMRQQDEYLFEVEISVVPSAGADPLCGFG